MMRMSFDDLRSAVHACPVATASTSGINALSRLPSASSTFGAATPPVVPDSVSELQVFFFGEGAAKYAAPATRVKALDAHRASMVCKDKNDFILFEPLEDAG